VQRVLREANVPAPFSTSASGDNALIELVCADAQGKPHRLEPGKENVIPFAERSTCRVLIHRERLRPEDGQQEVVLDVDVTAADGSARGSAGLHERMVLRPGGDVRVIPLKGGTRQVRSHRCAHGPRTRRNTLHIGPAHKRWTASGPVVSYDRGRPGAPLWNRLHSSRPVPQ